MDDRWPPRSVHSWLPAIVEEPSEPGALLLGRLDGVPGPLAGEVTLKLSNSSESGQRERPDARSIECGGWACLRTHESADAVVRAVIDGPPVTGSLSIKWSAGSRARDLTARAREASTGSLDQLAGKSELNFECAVGSTMDPCWYGYWASIVLPSRDDLGLPLSRVLG